MSVLRRIIRRRSCQRNNESTFNRLSCLSFPTQRNNKSSMSQYLEKYRVSYEEPVLFILRGIYNQEITFSIRRGIVTESRTVASKVRGIISLHSKVCLVNTQKNNESGEQNIVLLIVYNHKTVLLTLVNLHRYPCDTEQIIQIMALPSNVG